MLGRRSREPSLVTPAGDSMWSMPTLADMADWTR